MLVGVIPAAGHATRLNLRAGSKEMLPVGGRPVIDFLLERMDAAGPDEIRVVTRPEKADVREHVERRGARVVLGHPADVSASMLLGIAGLSDSDVVLLGFPDTLWQPADGLRRLGERVAEGAELALGLFETADAWRSDVVTTDAAGNVRAIAVKPGTAGTATIWGIAAARAATLRASLREGTEPGTAFADVAARGAAQAVFMSAHWLDIGTPESLARASRAPSDHPGTGRWFE